MVGGVKPGDFSFRRISTRQISIRLGSGIGLGDRVRIKIRRNEIRRSEIRRNEIRRNETEPSNPASPLPPSDDNADGTSGHNLYSQCSVKQLTIARVYS